MRIVVVEDDYLEEAVLKELLLKEWPAAEVQAIRTEADFLRELPTIEAGPPDIAFIDVMLRWDRPRPELRTELPEGWDGPYRAGIRCAERLLESARTSSVPIIVRSVVDFADEVRGLPPHVRFLSKDAHPASLIRLARSLIAVQRELSPTSPAMRDVFICHATEDRSLVVDPLVAAFESAGISVWHDRAEVRWGDRLVEKIQDGLRVSRFVLAVLSRYSVTSPWALRELESAFSGEVSDGVIRVLPLLVGSAEERAEILKRIPLQQDKVYEVWSGSTDVIVERLKERLR